MKIQDFCEQERASTEKREVRLLLIEGVDELEVDIASDSTAQRDLKSLYTITTINKSDSMHTKYPIPTSICCERLFSITVYALSNRRGVIPPLNFES